jgi:hypothetical protein
MQIYSLSMIVMLLSRNDSNVDKKIAALVESSERLFNQTSGLFGSVGELRKSQSALARKMSNLLEAANERRESDTGLDTALSSLGEKESKHFSELLKQLDKLSTSLASSSSSVVTNLLGALDSAQCRQKCGENSCCDCLILRL